MFRQCLQRGLFLKCPQCGKSKVFSEWMILKERCELCGCQIRSREDDTWFFMYMTTAGLTGFFILGMLLVTPRDVPFARVAIAVAAMVVFFVSQPVRKSIAIAVEYYVDSHSEHPKHPT